MKEFGFEDLVIDLSGIELFCDVKLKVKDNISLKETMNLYAKKNFFPEKTMKFLNVYIIKRFYS
jgi:hypothetical protein